MRTIFNLLFIILVLKISAEFCIIPDVKFGSIESPHSVGDNVTEGTPFNVSCGGGYQLNSTGVTKVSCVSDQMPASCREMKVSLSSKVVGAGQLVSVTCNVISDDEVVSISWYKDNIKFRQQEGSLTNSSSNYQQSLTFTSAVGDAGEYSCYANLNSVFEKEKYTGSTSLTVLGVTMSPAVSTYYPLIGETLPFTCNFTTDSTHSLNVVWKMGLGTITGVFEKDIGNIKSSFLTIPTAESYSNNYTCTGTYIDQDNKRIVIQKSIEAEVRGFTTQPKSSVVDIGNNASFTCACVGEKEGKVKWTLNDSPVTSFTSTYTNRRTTSILKLSNLEKQISSVNCSVEYEGIVLKSNEASLKALGLGIVSVPKDTAYAIGSDNTMTCVIRYEKDISTQLQWFKGSAGLDPDEVIEYDKYTTTKNDSFWSSVLYFTTVIQSNEGDYVCKAKYLVDSSWKEFASDPAHVYVRDVRFRPDKPWFVSTQNADTFTFTCYYIGDGAKGTGVEKVSWHTNNVNVAGASGFSVEEGAFSGNMWATKLVVSDMRPDAAGKVECQYECGVGGVISGSSMLYVHRYFPFPATSIAAASTSELTCSVLTNERANVIWHDNGKFVGVNHNNFKALPATTTNYTQSNILVINGWSYTKYAVAITCKYSYDTTDDTYSAKTSFIFKGFVQGPPSYAYYPPESVTLNCDFGFSLGTSKPTETHWKKDGAKLVSNDRYDISKTEQNGLWNNVLKIKAITGVINQDSGVYECAFKFSESEIYNRTTNIYFYTISTLPTTKQYYDTNKLTLTCTVTAKNMVVKSAKWISGGQDLKAPGYETKVSGTVITLTINNVVEVISGTFTCDISVEGATLTDSLSIEIRNIKNLNGDYKTVAIGDSLQLSCSVKNYTAVDLRWYKGNSVVGGTSESVYSSTILTTTLTIDKIQTTDLGTYKCGIGNSRSINSTTLSTSSLTSTSSVTVESGGVATLTCTLSDTPIEPSSVYWNDTSGNKMSSSDSSNEYKVVLGPYSSKSQSTTLTLYNVTKADVYTCNFVVSGSRSYRTSKVNVLYITTTPSTVYKGTATSIKCVLSGAKTSPSGVKWGTGGKTITNGVGGYTITTGKFITVDGSQTSALSLTSTPTSQTFTCTYIIGKEFSNTLTSHVYELTVPTRSIVHRNSSLTLSATFVSSTLSYKSDLVKEMKISSNTSLNGNPSSSVLGITYPEIITPMVVTFSFKDNANKTRSLQTEVYVAVFDTPIVSITDGSAVMLTCILKGLYSEPSDVIWYKDSSDKQSASTKSFNNGVLDTTYNIINPTADYNYTCEVKIDSTLSMSHYAVLDVFHITAPSKVTIPINGTVELTCTLSGAKYKAPTRVIWYRGNEQMLIQQLRSTLWPKDVTSTLREVDTPGNYKCFFDIGGKDYKKEISVKSATPIPDDESKSGTKMVMALSITIPLIIFLLTVVIVGYYYVKRKRRQSYRPKSYNVKPLSFSSSSLGGRAESLVYHNKPASFTDNYNTYDNI